MGVRRKEGGEGVFIVSHCSGSSLLLYATRTSTLIFNSSINDNIFFSELTVKFVFELSFTF